MMHCPLCGQAAHPRSSSYITATTKERYNQCTNINCGCTFVSHETFTRTISKPQSVPPPPQPGGQSNYLWLAKCPHSVGIIASLFFKLSECGY
ncbi:TPA: ogr/Delta-like zinc finger family protein [Serratia fonticola]|nr:ogr/Delta-like zinc finger family protein [Serratia fonticola]